MGGEIRRIGAIEGRDQAIVIKYFLFPFILNIKRSGFRSEYYQIKEKCQAPNCKYRKCLKCLKCLKCAQMPKVKGVWTRIFVDIPR